MKKCSQQKTISWFPVFQKQIFPSSPFSLLFMRKLSGKGLEPWMRMILCQSGHEKRKGTSGAIWTIITITWWISMDGIGQKGRSREIEMHSFLCLLRSQAHWRQLSQQLGTFLAVFFLFVCFDGFRKGSSTSRERNRPGRKETLSLNLSFKLLKQWTLKKWGLKKCQDQEKTPDLGGGSVLPPGKRFHSFSNLPDCLTGKE